MNFHASSSDDETQVDMDFFWSRKKNPTEKVQHYEDVDTTKYGYNHTPYEYPIFRDPLLQDKFQEYLTDSLNIPEDLIPSFSATEIG